jgi:hypothetical protein
VVRRTFMKRKLQKQNFAALQPVASEVRKDSLLFPLIPLTFSTLTTVTSLIDLLELTDRHPKHSPTSQPPSLKWHGRADCCPLSESIVLELNTLSPVLIAPPGMRLVDIRHKRKVRSRFGLQCSRNWSEI